MIVAMLLVGIGGAIGSALRYRVSMMFPVAGIPAGTLTVNTLGSFVLSLLSFSGVAGGLYDLICIGLLGGFTTFSSFGYETFRMIEERDHYTALANIVLNVACSLIGVYAGYIILA